MKDRTLAEKIVSRICENAQGFPPTEEQRGDIEYNVDVASVDQILTEELSCSGTVEKIALRLREELDVEYMNETFTWYQIEKGIHRLHLKATGWMTKYTETMPAEEQECLVLYENGEYGLNVHWNAEEGFDGFTDPLGLMVVEWAPKEFAIQILSEELSRFSERYNISIQLWPNNTAVYIEKDDVSLTDFGCSAFKDIETLVRAVNYLRKINHEIEQHQPMPGNPAEFTSEEMQHRTERSTNIRKRH